MAIQWDALSPGANIFGKAAEGYDQGRKMRSEREVRSAANIFARDPKAGTDAMIAAGRPDLASASMSARDASTRYGAREAGKAFAAEGDYAGAAKAAAGEDPEVARHFALLDQDALATHQKKGERSATVLMAASALPDPESRKAYIAQHSEELTGLGYTPEQIAGYDTADAKKMRADAARFMSLADVAGKTSVEKFGDYAVTLETDPIRGVRPTEKSLIPPTRTEQRQDKEFSYRQSHDTQEDTYRRDHDNKELGLRERELEMRKFIADNPDSSPAKVMGPIFRKLASGVVLSSGEQEAMRYYKLDPITANALGGEPRRLHGASPRRLAEALHRPGTGSHRPNGGGSSLSADGRERD